MASSLSLNGKDYVVSPEFAAHVKTALGTLSFRTDEVEAERLALLTRSNTQGFTERTVHQRVRDDDGEYIERDVVVRDPIEGLSSEDQQRLDYLTHVKNVANAIRVVGAHHDPVKEWSLDGWDAVHGNKHHRDCGCIRNYVFDHHSVTNHFGHDRVKKDKDVVLHQIEPSRLCPVHVKG